MKRVETNLGAHIEAMAEDDGYVRALYGRDGKVEVFVGGVRAKPAAKDGDGREHSDMPGRAG